MAKIEELRGELKLLRLRRAEIVATDHPSHYLREYIRIMNREVEILEAVNRSLHNNTGEVFRP